MSAPRIRYRSTGWRPDRPAVSLLLATVGYGLTFWVWTLIGPLGTVGQVGGTVAPLVGVTVVIGSLGRVPIGVLTDRYGARTVLPAISVCAALAAAMLTTVDHGPALGAAAVAAGVAGTAFAAGAALVVRAFRPARRGIALSAFGAGVGIAPAAGVLSRHIFPVDHRNLLLPLAVALLGYAVLAAVLIRDRAHRRPHHGQWGEVWQLLRLPATRQLSAWYAIAFGGLVALGLYLPAYLIRDYHLGDQPAVLYTAACLTLAAAARPVGGWLCQHHDPVPLLRTGFAASAVIALVLAFQPPFATTAAPALFAVAGCLGAVSGILQAVIGATAPPEQAGTITGTIGAVGGLAGLLPPLLLAAVYGVDGSHGIGVTLLAGAALAAAAYLHVHRRWIGAAMAFPAALGPQPTATTVIALPTIDSTAYTAQLTAPLVTLASQQELVIVTVLPGQAGANPDGHPLVTALRAHLPRHKVIAIVVGASPHPVETGLIGEILDDGGLPVVLTTGTRPDSAALHLAAAFHADRVLVQPPWTANLGSTR